MRCQFKNTFSNAGNTLPSNSEFRVALRCQIKDLHLILGLLILESCVTEMTSGNMKKHPSALNSCLYYYYYIYFMLQDTGYWQELLGATGHTSAQLVWLLGQLIHIVL